MKKTYTLLILASLILLTACSSNLADNQQNSNIDIDTSDYEATPGPNAQNEQPANASCSHDMPYSNLPLNLESIPNRLSNEHINQLFEYTYKDIKNCDQCNVFEGQDTIINSPFKFPYISIDYSMDFYFSDLNPEATASYIECSNYYDFQPLNELQIYSSMTLKDITELDEQYVIQEQKTDNVHEFFIEIATEQYEFYLSAYDKEYNISKILVKRKGYNAIDETYDIALHLVEKFSNYSGVPVLYNKGNINKDSYEDLIITIERDDDTPITTASPEVYMNAPLDRVTLILFGSENGYTKHGEIEGLVDSSTSTMEMPLIDIKINEGKIFINQYGGLSLRWNTFSIYDYDEKDKKLYLSTYEYSSYYDARPLEETHQSVVKHYNKSKTILDTPPVIEKYEYDDKLYVNEKISIIYPDFKNPSNEKEQFIFDATSKHIQMVIDKVKEMDVEGEFEIDVYTNVANNQFTSLALTLRGDYKNLSKDPLTDYYNDFYYESNYVNLDLVNYKEINLLDTVSIHEVTSSLYSAYNEYCEANPSDDPNQKLLNEKDIRQAVIESTNDPNNKNNPLKFYYNDVTVNLILQYDSDEDYHHTVETTLLTPYDFNYKPLYLSIWDD